MLRDVGQSTGVPIFGVNQATSKDKVDDVKIPCPLSAAIEYLPGVDSTGVSPLSIQVREYLIDKVYHQLSILYRNNHFRVWVHGSGKELGYCEEDFAEELAFKLGLTAKE